MLDFTLTSPGWAGKYDSIFSDVFKPAFQNLETVSLNPPDLVAHAIDLGVLFGAPKNLRVFLNCENTIPAAGPGKCDDVSTNSGEGVDQGLLLGGSAFS